MKLYGRRRLKYLISRRFTLKPAIIRHKPFFHFDTTIDPFKRYRQKRNARIQLKRKISKVLRIQPFYIKPLKFDTRIDPFRKYRQRNNSRERLRQLIKRRLSIPKIRIQPVRTYRTSPIRHTKTYAPTTATSDVQKVLLPLLGLGAGILFLKAFGK